MNRKITYLIAFFIIITFSVIIIQKNIKTYGRKSVKQQIKFLKKQISKNKDDSIATIELGNLYLRIKEKGKALQLYN